MGLTGHEAGRTDARLRLLCPVNNWSQAVFEEREDRRSWPQESCRRRQTLSFQPLSRVWLFVTPGRLQHARLPRQTPAPRVCSHSSSRYHPIVLTHHVCGWFSTKWHFRATNMTLNYSSLWIRRKWGWGVATQLSIPALWIPRTEEAGGLPSIGLQLTWLSACA